MALLARKQRDLDEELRLWRELKAQYSKFPHFYINIIKLLIQNKNFREANVEATALNINFPQSYYGLLYLATIAFMEDDFQQACVYSEKLISIHPDIVDGWSLFFKSKNRYFRNFQKSEVFSLNKRFHDNEKILTCIADEALFYDEYDIAIDFLSKLRCLEGCNKFEYAKMKITIYSHDDSHPFGHPNSQTFGQ